MRTFLRELPAELRESIAVGGIDTDPEEHRELCKVHAIRNLPYLALYRDGSLVDSVTGLQMPRPDEVIDHIRRLIYAPIDTNDSNP